VLSDDSTTNYKTPNSKPTPGSKDVPPDKMEFLSNPIVIFPPKFRDSGNIFQQFFKISPKYIFTATKLQPLQYSVTYFKITKNKKAQLSLTNPRDACEKFARFT